MLRLNRNQTKGILLCIVGGLLLAMGIIMVCNMNSVRAYIPVNAAMFPLTFCGFGAAAITMGIAHLIAEARERKTCKRLVDGGEYVYADITRIVEDTSTVINGCSTCVLECRYCESATGREYVFRSNHMPKRLAATITRSTVKVFVDKKSRFRNYYVDLRSVLDV